MQPGHDNDAPTNVPDELLDRRNGLRLVKIRLALTLLAVAILPLAAVAPMMRAVLLDTRAGLEERLSAEAEHAAAEVSRELGGITAGLAGIAGLNGVAAAAAAEPGDPAAGPVAAALTELLKRPSGILEAVAITDPSGVPHALVGSDGVPRSGAPPPTSNRPFVTLVTVEANKPAFIEVAIAIPPAADAAAGAAPTGTVVASISVAALLDWASPGAATAGRTVRLVDGDNTVVATVGPGIEVVLPGTVIDIAANGSEASEAHAPIALPALKGWHVLATAPLPVTAIPVPTIAALIGLIGLLVAFTVWMGRQIVHPAAVLEEERARFHELYAAAREASLRDSLTGLGNHRAFQEAVGRMVDQSRRYGTPFSLVLLDIDEFKRVNDTRGHATGDELLAEVGNLIRATVRQADAGFRIGGDEFAILLASTDAAGAEVTARRLLSRGLEDRSGGRYRGPISFSAGITGCPAFGTTRLELTAQADAALYRGKRAGRTMVSIFDPALDRGHVDEEMRAELSAAVSVVIETGALSPVYQPIVHLPTGRILGYEGLVRVRPDAGFPHTGALFDAAEVAGRVLDLDRAALDVVLRGAAQIPESALLSINVSPRSFEAPEFNATVFLAILRRHGIAPERAILELTERDAIREPERLRAAIRQLQEAGVRVAADDVGAGNAGLRLLSQFRFDVVKIDLSLVQGGASQDQTLAVLTSLVGLARRWGALTIAEGVETAAQLQMIRGLEVDAGQGYLLGRPGAILGEDRLDLDALAGGPAPVPVAPAPVPAAYPTPAPTADPAPDLDVRTAIAGPKSAPFVSPFQTSPRPSPTAASVISGGAPNPFAPH
ncbi:MAG: Sensor diguanylate cyclase [Chloroflexi bacterium]|nr:Sensor diguanylate cyclase [Chloroflexota bacterium]